MGQHPISLTYLHGASFEEEAGTVRDFRHLPRPLHSVAYIESGEAEFICNGKCMHLRAGDVVYVAKGSCYHSIWRGTPKTIFFSCHFDLVPFGAPIGTRIYPIQVIQGCQDLREAFTEIATCDTEPLASLYAVGSFFQILSKLFARMHYERDLTLNYRIVEAVRYIEAHYDTPLRVPELAQLCHVSPSYFYECFKREIGMSPIEYKNKITVLHAERALLDHPDTSIEELSEQLGFESSIYFRRLFKAHTGKTPREYRNTADRSM
jgi:AraC-like DNA-binding protein